MENASVSSYKDVLSYKDVPKGWKIGWKVVLGKHRQPVASDPKTSVAWFSGVFPKVASLTAKMLYDPYSAKKGYMHNVKEVQYLKGSIVKARNENTGRVFKNAKSLKNFRSKIHIRSWDYGPAIHVYTSYKTAKHMADVYHADDSQIILIAYDPKEIVETGEEKIGVFKVKVLT